MNKEYFKQYYKLTKELDELSEKITNHFGKDVITCKKGCHSCCVNLTLMPVEFYAIKELLDKDGIDFENVDFDSSKPCGFLKNGSCQIYKYRPVICRTQGLPLIFRDENDNWTVSYCELNFTETGKTYSFDAENTLNLDMLNYKLALLNEQFLVEFEEDIDSEERMDAEDLLY